MAIYARFIGIDKYDNPRIGDLNGAERDATALHALFSDSLADIDSELLLSSTASRDAVADAISGTLARAGQDDVALLYFAGHGSPDHRLIVRDSNPADHAATSIGMEEIAEAFRATEARVAICILDCCFSGGATARVFTEVPLPRMCPFPDPDSFTGKGRVLITASSSDEPAYEHPTARHGLFTMALIEALQQGTGHLSLVEVASQVLDMVRAEAARIGVDQTPVFLGEVSGGLGLPTLKRGPVFLRAFPETHSASISSDIADLALCGIPAAVVDTWKMLFPSGLNALQVDAVNERRLLRGNSVLVVAPTSAGKTFVGELAAAKAVSDGKKAVFLLPYKALVNEKFDQFTSLYGESLGLRVIRCTGDYQDQNLEMLKGKYDLALLTYEMFLNMVVSNPHVLNQIGLVVVDEAQFVTDPNRGISIELLLTLLLYARERGICPQLVCLSAVIGDVNSFDQWLGCESLVRTDRPVALIEGVIDRTGVWQYRDVDGQVKEERLLSHVMQRREKPSAQDVIVPLVSKLVADGEQVIVFRNQRGSAQGCARYLAQDLGLPPASGVADELPDTDLSKASADLRFCVSKGTAFHTSNLVRDERAVIERAFRDSSKGLRVLGATTTVAAGINTPASTVIVAEQEFRGDDGREFTVAEYKNMAGRAGRLGYNEKGKAIIYAETPTQRRQLFARYVLGRLEPITSSFDPRDVDTWVLRLLAQVDSVPYDQVTSLLANTFGGFLLVKHNPDGRVNLHQRVEDLLSRMLDLDLVERDGENVRLTLLGRACGRSALSFGSAMRLVDLVRRVRPDQLTAETLLALVQALPESCGGYTPMMKKGQSEYVRPGQASARFGAEVVRLLQSGCADQMEYLARCKRAAVLGDWIDGVPLEEIEAKFTPNPFQGVTSAGSIRGFADATRLYYRAAFGIAALVQIDSHIDVDEVDLLLKRLEVGIPKQAVQILDFLPNADRGTCLALWRRGLLVLEACLSLPDEELAMVTGKRVATTIRALGISASVAP